MQVRVFSSLLMQECVHMCVYGGVTRVVACAISVRVNKPIRWQLWATVRYSRCNAPTLQ